MIVVDALGPVFLLVLLGAGLRRLDFPGGDFWPLAERLTYYVFFPALLIHTLAEAPFTAADLGRVFAAVAVLMIGVTAVLVAFSRLMAPTGAAFTSVYQGAARFNTYVGLAAASGLWGADGLAVAAVAVACMIPLVNLLCIGIFTVKVGQGGSPVRQVVANPLIVGCVIGIALNLSGIGLPGWSEPLLGLLGRPALPVGLLAVGVGLTWHGMKSGVPQLVNSSVVKLAVFPLLAFWVGRAMGLDEAFVRVLVLFFALPTASSAYILARQLGGDGPLMAAIVTAQTLLAMLTLPLVLALLPIS